MKNRSKGFSLVVVLALVAIGSVVVFTSVRDNVIQERLAGNFQKSLNARMLSERGVFEQINAIQNFLINSPNADAQELALLVAPIDNNSVHSEDLRYTAALTSPSPSNLAIQGYGERYGGDAVSNLLFNFSLAQTGANSPFGTALIGCEGVAVGNGSVIDSYDSSLNNGIYDPANATSDAEVLTIEQDSDITLSGASITAGNVTSTGSVTLLGTSFVGGTIRANGNIDISGGHPVPTPLGFPDTTRVGGDIETQGNVEYQGGLVLGVIRAEGNVTFNPEYGVADSNGTGSPIQYGGILTLEQAAVDRLSNPGNEIDHSGVAAQPPGFEVPEVTFFDPDNIPVDFDTENPLTNCDPLSITSAVADISNGETPEPGVSLGYDNFGATTSARFTPDIGTHINTEFSPRTKSAFGINLDSFYFLEQLSIQGGQLTIAEGDVVIVVAGDFLFTSDQTSEIHIEEGASLTLIVNGTTVIQKAANIERPQLSDNGLPPFSLYSTYQNDNPYDSDSDACNTGTSNDYGIIIDSITDNYLALYAPFANVAVRSSGAIYGAVRGKGVSLCGSGDIHFDVDLNNITAGTGNGGNSTLLFQGLRFNAGN